MTTHASWTNTNVSAAGNFSNFTSPDPDPILPGGAKVCLILLYTLTIAFSTVGNILVVIVFTKGRRCRTDIRPFLINLAISDLIMALICMPFTFTFVMTRTWIFSKPLCPIVLFTQCLSVSASVFTNMAIGIDRFLVVTFPLKARMTWRRAKYTLCIIWLCSTGLSSVQLVVGRATDHGVTVDCDERWGSPNSRRTFTMFVLFITYITPLTILAITYSVVSILLWKRTAPGNAHEVRDIQQLKAKRKIIKMLVLVVIMFGLCWLPLHTFFLVIDFNPHLMEDQSETERRLFTVIYYLAFWLAMSNSCANPIIYGFTNESFRADLASLCYIWFPFCICFKKLASRKLSVSTNDSMYNKRFSSTRKSPNSLISRQSTCRNGSKVHIDFRKDRDKPRGRSHANMNDFYRDGLELEALESNSNGSCGHCCHLHHVRQQRRHYHKARHHQGGRCAGTSPYAMTSNASDRQQTSSSDDVTVTCSLTSNSPTSLSPTEQFHKKMADCRRESILLYPLPELEAGDL